MCGRIWYAIRRVFSIRLDRFPQFFINAAVAADVAFKVLHSISVWLSLSENFRRPFKANEASATYEIYCWRVSDVVIAAPASSVTIGYRECCRLLTAIALNGIIFTVRCFLGWIWKFICFLCILPSSSYLAYSLAFLCSFHFPTFNEPNDRQLFFQPLQACKQNHYEHLLFRISVLGGKEAREEGGSVNGLQRYASSMFLHGQADGRIDRQTDR